MMEDKNGLRGSAAGKKGERRFLSGLGLSAAAAAPFFLFNPDYAVIDVLPDVLGYLLMCLSLRKLRDLNERLETAARRFYYLCWLGAAKFLSVFLLYGAFNEQERPTAILLFGFCFAFGEILLGFGAWSGFFTGLISLCQTTGGTVGLLTDRRGRNVTQKIRDLTLFFLCAKEVLTWLPEFSVLSSQRYDDSRFDWYEFIALYRVLGIFLTLILGVVWLCAAVRYMIRVLRDRELENAALERYRGEVLCRRGLFELRGIRAVFVCLVLSCALTCDFYLDSVNFLPDFLAGAAFCIFFLMMKKYSGRWKYGLACSGLYAVLCGWSWAGSVSYHREFTDYLVQKSPEAFRKFMTYYPVRVLENLLLCTIAVLVMLCLKDLVWAHCGYIPETLSEEYRENKLRDIRSEVMKRVYVCGVFGIFAGLSGTVYDWLITFPELLIGEVWWIVCLGLSVGFAVSAVSAASAVTEEAESRYMLE